MTFDYRKAQEWKRRNAELKEKRDKLQANGIGSFTDHSEAEFRAIDENQEISYQKKDKLKLYLKKLLTIQHMVQKYGDLSEYLNVIEIKQRFINDLDISKEDRETLNGYWKKYK